MAHTDQIADMLTRIRNAGKALKKSVDIPASGVKQEVARILQEHQYIKKYVVVGDGKQGIIKVLLNYNNGEVVIRGIKRVSKPGCRIYRRSSELKPVLRGLGIAIVSTSKGVMIDDDCRKMNIGGEVLCNVW